MLDPIRLVVRGHRHGGSGPTRSLPISGKAVIPFRPV